MDGLIQMTLLHFCDLLSQIIECGADGIRVKQVANKSIEADKFPDVLHYSGPSFRQIETVIIAFTGLPGAFFHVKSDGKLDLQIRIFHQILRDTRSTFEQFISIETIQQIRNALLNIAGMSDTTAGANVTSKLNGLDSSVDDQLLCVVPQELSGVIFKTRIIAMTMNGWYMQSLKVSEAIKAKSGIGKIR